MPWPMRFGPPPRMMILLAVGRLGLALAADAVALVGRVHVGRVASRTRRRRCRRACRPGARRARGARRATSASVGAGELGRGGASEKPLLLQRAAAPSASCRQAVAARARASASTISLDLRAGTTGRYLAGCVDLLDASGRARKACGDVPAGGRASGCASAPRSPPCRGVARRSRSRSRPSRPVSRRRSAFCSDSWKVRPIAITSPTDFICGGQQRLGAAGISRRRSAASW